jgi:hypothetical protein
MYFLCKYVLPPGVHPIAVDKYINIYISIFIIIALQLCIDWQNFYTYYVF